MLCFAKRNAIFLTLGQQGRRSAVLFGKVFHLHGGRMHTNLMEYDLDCMSESFFICGSIVHNVNTPNIYALITELPHM